MEYLLVDAEARAYLLGDVELPDPDQRPWEIGIHVTVTGFKKDEGPLVLRTKTEWLLGSRQDSPRKSTAPVLLLRTILLGGGAGGQENQ